MFLQLNVPNVFLAEPVKILPRSSNNKIYRKTISDDLKNASRDNPKHFRKILGEHKRKQQPNIEINSLYECFKDLNSKVFFCLANLVLVKPRFLILAIILVNCTINVFTIKCSKRFLGRTCEDIAKVL
jgi:hypothetical protein